MSFLNAKILLFSEKPKEKWHFNIFLFLKRLYFLFFYYLCYLELTK